MNDSVPRRFPETRDSLVQALASSEADARMRAFDLVVRAYRAPVIALLARRWSLEHADAEDLAQEFFATALEKDWLGRYDSARGRFRTFLRSCLFAFASTEHDRMHAEKRGGRVLHEALDDQTPHEQSNNAVDALFEQEWIRSVLQMALDALRLEAVSANKIIAFQLFERYDVAGSDDDSRPTYAALAVDVGLPVTQVTNYLSWARKRFRQHVLNTLRELTGNDEEYRHEVQTLLGRHAG